MNFFWYWKSTANYKQWKKKDRFSVEGAANFRLDHAIALKVFDCNSSCSSSQHSDGGEVSRNSRLRKRARVDYSYSNIPLVRETPEKV